MRTHGWQGGRPCTRALRRTWPLALMLASALLVAIPAVARAENAGGTPDIGGLAQLQDALNPSNPNSGMSIFNVPAGTFDPAGPTPEAVARAIETERITKDGYPKYFQVTEVYVVTKVSNGPDTEGMWAVRYRTNLQLGVVKDPVFIEIVTYNPSKNIPLGAGGLFSIDPAWTMQGWAADLAGQGATAQAMQGWLSAHPAQAGQVAAAGGVAAVMAALLGLVNSFGSAPKPGTGRNTALSIPSQLKPYREPTWHWVMDPATGKRQLQQGLFVDQAGTYVDSSTGAARHFEAGEFYPVGKPLAGSIFDVPDPSMFGNRIAVFAQPVPDMTSAGTEVAGTISTSVKDTLVPAAWNAADAAHRADALRAAIRAAADATGVDPNTIHIDIRPNAAEPNLGGLWTPSTRTLFVNTLSKDFKDPKAAIATACHELRHAAQSDPKNGLRADADYRALMNHNESGYVTPETDYTRYAGQLMERDAQNFGDAVSRGITGGK
jgi:hypothetical protein